MKREARTKKSSRLTSPAEDPAHPDSQSLQEGEGLLRDMAQAYFGSAPRLFELAGSFLKKGRHSEVEALDTSAEESSDQLAVLVIDSGGLVRALDAQAELLFGRSEEEVLGRDISDLVHLPDGDEEPVSVKLAKAREARHRNGNRFPVRIRIQTLNLGKERLQTVVFRRLETAAGSPEMHRRAEARYRALVEQIPAVTFMASFEEKNHELYVSPQIEELLGFSADEWISDPIRWFYQIHPEDRQRMSMEFARSCLLGGSFRGDFRVLTREGAVLWVHCETRLVRDDQGEPLFLQGVGFDITETKAAEEQMRTSLKEKEVLLKEIHHRVKNNLQITSSLLRLQAPQIKDPDTRIIFTESESRIRSMALVHEKLYQSPDLANIEFSSYVRELSTYLTRAYNVSPTQIRIRFELQQAHLEVHQAIPCALILNELLSNCLKHAFPEGRAGEITIGFDSGFGSGEQAHRYRLVVRDDGKGLPTGFALETAKGLGLTLVRNLAQQIDGTLSYRSNDQGTEFELQFEKKPG